MNTSTEHNKNGYLERNRWVLYLLMALMVVAAQQVIGSLDMGFKLPDILIYIVSCVLLIYAGILNALSGTTTAKIFQGLVVGGLIAAVIWFIVGKI
jgi:hypothetical protein|uniref:hypothetical protein n=1 Tax=Serratia entomophila TaxID=42906 RepID=UPI001F4C0DDD|nr:hypothetical protein [Serratia entomophila]ULG11299.1 hypothetical protein 345p3_00009 [Serratia entomophila]